MVLVHTIRRFSIGSALLAPLLCLCEGAVQEPARPKPPPALKKLGILVYPGVQVIDFTGPYEVLSSVFFQRKKVFDVVTIGLGPETIRTSPGFEGLRLTPDFTIDDCPKLDLLLIPGGETGSVSGNPKAMEWIARTVKDAECVMSVCNGAFILAKGGHLKNQSATTFFYFIDELKQDEPTCTPIHDRRFVDNGKIITAAGLSSGIDAALHLVERYTDHFTAEQKALGLEYHWQPESDWTRGNLADRHYISMVGAGFEFPDGSVSDWTTVENHGSVEHWTKRWTFRSALKREDLLEILEPKLAASWTRATAQGDASAWEFKDEHGRPWRAVFTLDLAGDRNWTMTLQIDKQKP
jgi:putative intracellular protease/amidase